MQMRSCHAPCRSDETNLLSPSNSVTLCNQCATHVEVTGDNAGAMIDVNDISREKEIRHERDNTSIRCVYWRAEFSCEVHSEMRARQNAIE